MVLKIISSGSVGNCYILENKKEALVIEAGVSLKKVKEAMQFNISKIVALISTHVHGDHSAKTQEFVTAGITTYGSVDVFEKYKGAKQMTHKQLIKVGGFKIMPLEVKHDVENFCLLIHHEEMGACLYASDCHYLPYIFPGLNQFIIEANYSLEIMNKRVSSGSLPKFLRERIINSHMDFETTKGVMKANDISKVNNIILIHLSDGNSNAEQFQKEMTALTGKRVTIAEAGLVMDFNKEF